MAKKPKSFDELCKLADKYNVERPTDKTKFIEISRQIEKVVNQTVPLVEIEENYRTYIAEYEKMLDANVKEQKARQREIQKRREKLKEFKVTDELVQAIPEEVKDAYQVITAELCRLMAYNTELNNGLEKCKKDMAEIEASVEQHKKETEEFIAKSQLDTSNERIAELEREVEALKLGNKDLTRRLGKAYRDNVRFVMVRPDQELGDYIHDLEERNNNLEKENEIYQEYYEKYRQSQDDLHTADQVCAQYEEENDKLRIENQKLHGKIMSMDIQLNSYKDRYGNRSLINYGQETDIYSGEIKDMILSAISEKFANCEDIGCRQAIVLRDILEANEKDGTRDELRRFLFENFKDYKGYTSLDIRALSDHGFEVAKGSKHAEVYFKNYPKVQAPISVTPSDSSHIQNTAACIAAKLL